MKSRLLAISLLLCAAWPSVQAQPAYPSKPIRLVVGFPPGGGADAVARIVANKMAQELGQPIIIDNKPGGGTTIATSHVAGSAPDGYTLLQANSLLFGIDKVLYKSIKYSAKDFVPITKWTSSPLMLVVNTSLPVKSAGDLIAQARLHPGKYFFASSGSGGSPHLAGALFDQLANVEMVHVPFKGGAGAVQSVVANETQLTFATPPSVIQLVEAGRLRSIAVTTAKRSSLFPDLPTIAEQGLKDFDLSSWFGLLAPAKTPAAITERLYQASVNALKDPEVRKNLALQGNEVAFSTSQNEFGEWMVRQGATAKRIAEQASITLD